tara:strand:- start:415 stop:1191 length:777 start_codon:yes stop_codon:yes gene_type:complete
MFINKKNFITSLKKFGQEGPFDHCVIDNFFKKSIATKLEKEFPSFEADIWHQYNNPIEVKKLCNNWNSFPETTYQVFNYLNSHEIVETLRNEIFDKKMLYSDIGLNGGGWHIHKRGGKLNTHLDYSLHPKLGLQRKLNIIIYLNSSWKPKWGGNLGLWSNESEKKPGNLVKEIEPKFNRAVLFDTTQNSWHGLPNPLKCPKNQYRKSLAVYYLCDPPRKVSKRGKALFAPTPDQEGDKSILKLIKTRSNIKTASKVYN